MKKNRLTLIVITIISFIFFFSIGFDISPYLRGPAPYPPDWRWPYQFTNTISKLWFPALTIVGLLFFFFYIEKLDEREINKKQWVILAAAIFLHFLFQFSILFFSRAGIGVLLQRIIQPDMNGYFTAALSIKNIPQFLSTYNESVLSFPMHATGHPPGSILFFWLVNQLSAVLTPLQSFISSIRFSHQDVQLIWNALSLNQKFGAFVSTSLIPLFSSLSLLLVFVLGKELYSVRAAIRSVFLFMTIPAIVLFVPLSDVFFPLFFLLSFWVFLKGLRDKKLLLIFLSGILFFLGLFFSMSLLPLLLLFAYFIFLYSYKKKLNMQKLLSFGFAYVLGLVILPFLLFVLFQFNSLAVAKTLISWLPKGRQYHVWILYNLYDFFVYTGIPLFLLYVKMILSKVKDHLFIAFTIMLLLLNFSGAVRGEVGRIWIPFMPVLVLFIANFLTYRLKFSKNYFAYILFLQAVQIVIMQEFWVPLW